ncbi:TPA: hypothetical protein HA239_05140 [Candidatus Woesearchaeota archaeon]|nr:hypothetical protein QT06_C0001G0313 [archaeon GW2011_AR15]MBS3103632.1 hypothetical protein [Candidatus Woesearchaeota archaeon]HIH41768.1 hypothetical protein [Candidatus Woesearchaeota archaeon]
MVKQINTTREIASELDGGENQPFLFPEFYRFIMSGPRDVVLYPSLLLRGDIDDKTLEKLEKKELIQENDILVREIQSYDDWLSMARNGSSNIRIPNPIVVGRMAANSYKWGEESKEDIDACRQLLRRAIRVGLVTSGSYSPASQEYSYIACNEEGGTGEVRKELYDYILSEPEWEEQLIENITGITLYGRSATLWPVFLRSTPNPRVIVPDEVNQAINMVTYLPTGQVTLGADPEKGLCSLLVRVLDKDEYSAGSRPMRVETKAADAPGYVCTSNERASIH